MISGEELKTIRQHYKITIDEIAEFMFVSRQTIWRIEQSEYTKESTINYYRLALLEMIRKTYTENDTIDHLKKR